MYMAGKFERFALGKVKLNKKLTFFQSLICRRKGKYRNNKYEYKGLPHPAKIVLFQMSLLQGI